MEKKPRKPKTPSIKQHLTDAGYPDAHKLDPPPQVNTFTDKDGTTYKWKVGEKPTEIPSALTGIKQTSSEVPSEEYRPVLPPELGQPSSLLNTDNYRIAAPIISPLEILDRYRQESEEDSPPLRHLSYEQQKQLQTPTFERMKGGQQ